jgi:hypothetical protein
MIFVTELHRFEIDEETLVLTKVRVMRSGIERPRVAVTLVELPSPVVGESCRLDLDDGRVIVTGPVVSVAD